MESDYQPFNLGGANNRKYWSSDDDLIALDKSLSVKERALKLGRSSTAVTNRVTLLNRNEARSTYVPRLVFNHSFVDPNKAGTRYTEEEDELLRDSSSPSIDLAVLLGRSHNSVQNRRQRLKEQKEGVDVKGRDKIYNKSRDQINAKEWRKKNKDKQAVRGKKYFEFNRNAKNQRKKWTPEADAIVLDTDLTPKVRAMMLGRSISAVYKRCEKLKK